MHGRCGSLLMAVTPTSARNGTAVAGEQISAMLRLVITGSVDDGKSTLIGRLLYDSKQILNDQLEALQLASERRNGGGSLDLSLLTDGLRAEREQGITIDVAYRYFPRRASSSSPTRPGMNNTPATWHRRFDRRPRMILIDARNGVVEQTRRHAFIATLLGIRHSSYVSTRWTSSNTAGPPLTTSNRTSASSARGWR